MNNTLKTLLCGTVISAGAVSANAATKHLGILLPYSTEWLSNIPMISFDGGKTGEALKVDKTHCGWVYADLDASDISDNVVFYRKGDTDRLDMIGINGNWETSATPTPIPLATLFSSHKADTLYFVTDQEQFLADDDNGWYTQFPEGVEGVCQYSWPMVIYDTDAKLHPAFSCYAQGGEGCQEGVGSVTAQEAIKAINDCIGITTGIVADTLDTSVNQFKRKPILTDKGTKCFINETYFNQLFSATQGVNEASCTDIPLSRNNQLQWEFNSDYYTNPGTKVPGGFFPVELTTNELITKNGQTPLEMARTKRDAQGPIFYGPDLRELDNVYGHPKIDLLCNGAGWDGGVDCEGGFAGGDNTETLIKKLYPNSTCIIGWFCPDKAPTNWTFFKSNSETPLQSSENKFSGNAQWFGERNQHFCTETHAVFNYAEGQTFSVLGDDDIWVFIDNKLAIDLGGSHQAAPGFVNLDKFEGRSGKLVEGKAYALDMFTCDRRTTMSNLTIRTNIFVRNLPYELEVRPVKNSSTSTSSYELCYHGTISSCQDMIEGNEDVNTCKPLSNKVQYYLSKNGFVDVDTDELLENGKIHHEGIDLTNPAAPQIDRQKIDLPEGSYYLFAKVNEKAQMIATFHVGGVDAITTKPVVAINMKVHADGSSISITAQGAKAYAVMDMMGRVLKSGNLQNGQASIPMTRKGNFMVRVGSQTQRVILK